jgi:hypothetical protein
MASFFGYATTVIPRGMVAPFTWIFTAVFLLGARIL